MTDPNASEDQNKLYLGFDFSTQQVFLCLASSLEQ